MIQQDTARDIARRLLAGDHYLLVGREYMAKSLLLKLVVQTIEDQAMPGTRVAFVDFAREGVVGWLPTVTQKLFEGQGAVSAPDGLLPLVRMWHAAQPAATRLVLVFDHVDRLAEDALGDFSRQCSSLVHELAAESTFATSMLWCGEEVAMEAAFKQADAFLRRTHEYRAVPYTESEVGAILDECSRRRAFRFSPADKHRIYELTEGLPALVRDVENSLTQRIAAAVIDSPLLPNVVAETIEREIPGFVDAIFSDRDHLVHGPHDCFPAYVVSRIEHDERLLNLVLEMRLSRDPVNAFRLPVFSRHDEDLLVFDAGGTVRFRGLLLDQFVRRVFDLRRLTLAFFFLDESLASLGKSQICGDLRDMSAEVVAWGHAPSPRLENRLLSHVAKRLHAARTEAEVLSLLGFTMRLLGWADAALLQCADATYVVVDGIPLLDGVIAKGMSTLSGGHAPYVVDAARRDRHVKWDAAQHMAAAPLTVEGVARFVLLVGLSHDADGHRQPATEALPEMLSTLQTVAAMAEGPLGGIAARQRAAQDLAERDRELAMLRGIPPLRAELQESVDSIMGSALSTLAAIGLRGRVRLSLVLFAKALERVSRPPPPVLSEAQDSAIRVHGKGIVWLDEKRGWGVLPLQHGTTRLGRIEFMSRSERPVDARSRHVLSALADEYAAHLCLLAESSRTWFYRFVFDSLSSGVQVLDRQLNILAMNAPLEKVLRERDGFTEDWHDRKCYEVHRLSGQPKRCDICTTWKAWESGREEDQLERWPSRRFGERKMLCHYVESTPIRDGNRIVGAVEISRPPTVGEVVAELSSEILNAHGRMGIMKVLAKACLMLGFDRCRFYWIDPFTGLLAPQIMTMPGQEEAVGIHDRPIDPHSEHVGSGAFLRMMRSLRPCLLRRRGWGQEKVTAPSRIPDDNVFRLDSLPFPDELEHGELGEILMVPFVWQERALGFVSADYLLLNRPMDDDDTKRLCEFASVATQFILTAERAENVNLVAVLAHQTTQPYDAILATTHEMSRCDDVEHRKALQEVVRSTVMTSLAAFETRTRYLRDFTCPEGPTDIAVVVAKNRHRVRISVLFDYVIGTFGALCRSKGIELTKSMDTDSQRHDLRVNIPLIQEALTNLVQNAMNALPERLKSGDTKKIELRATWVADHLCVDISDNGCGIPESEQKAVFEPYVSMSGKGFGIGLAVVKRNLVAHGFRIGLIPPQSGFSTTFRIDMAKEARR